MKRVAEKTGWKDIIGMPDEWDRKNLRALILNYEKEFPGKIAAAIKQAREQVALDNTKFAVASNESNMRHVLELPADLAHRIEQAYPTMFRDKQHLAWFIKNFKAFLIPDKY